jgi:hypothetical protein
VDCYEIWGPFWEIIDFKDIFLKFRGSDVKSYIANTFSLKFRG